MLGKKLPTMARITVIVPIRIEGFVKLFAY